MDIILSILGKIISSLLSKGKDSTNITENTANNRTIVPNNAIPDPKQAIKLNTVSFVLTHTDFVPSGIFGELRRQDNTFVCYTLEHSYDDRPKLANGEYTCIRGSHRLDGMTENFITFEITGIPDFDGKPVTGVLFHWGNYNKDSEGCVLMGKGKALNMITNSKKAWSDFMQSLEGIDRFRLTVN